MEVEEKALGINEDEVGEMWIEEVEIEVEFVEVKKKKSFIDQEKGCRGYGRGGTGGDQ